MVQSQRRQERVEEEIQARKRLEQALGDCEEKYQLIANNATDAIFIAQDGVIKFSNLKGEELAGYSVEELNDFPIARLVHPEDREMVIGRYKRRLKGEAVPDTYSFRLVNRKGEELWTRINAVLVPWEGSPAILGFVRDITEQRHAEARVRQAQKMEAIGTLAGGIAHDFNNILSAIIGYAELVWDDLPSDNHIKANLHEMLEAGKRAKELVKQILTFSRQSEKELVPLELHLVVKEALRLMRSSLPVTIEIQEDMATSCKVMADPTAIHQVVMNLCTNAYHAMREGGGILDVHLSEVCIDSLSASQYPHLGPGPYARLAVSDTGHGMDSAVMERIFEPYFTKKKKGEGTGLGLSVVHGIVKSHGGTITVYSEPGKGTTFHVYLPMITAATEEVEAETEKPPPTGCERILFIDDELPLVEIGRQMLQRLGYEVVTRTSSIEALELFRAKPHGFDLVITDMTMPNMTGDNLAAELMRIRPNTPVVLCTGYSERISEERASGIGIRAFLMKPIVKRTMAETIRNVLDQATNVC